MALPALLKEKVAARLEEYSADRVPEHARDEVRVVFKIRGDHVTLFEERPRFGEPEEWVRIPVAQFRYVAEASSWLLFWPDRKGRWMLYGGARPSSNLDELLAEVDRDPSGIFWG